MTHLCFGALFTWFTLFTEAPYTDIAWDPMTTEPCIVLDTIFPLPDYIFLSIFI